MRDFAETRQAETRRIVESCGALMTDDHFVYASGEHGHGWIAKDLINVNPEYPRRLSQLLAETVRDLGIQIDVVCGPAVGGVICAQYTALALERKCVFTERTIDRTGFELKRRYGDVVDGRSVLLVDDIINTGWSTGLSAEAIRAKGGQVTAVGAWINRGNVGASDLGVDHFVFLDEVPLPSIPARRCPMCKQGVAVNTDYAHGREFVEGVKSALS
jgi:orotate phosphoribosyltransferase